MLQSWAWLLHRTAAPAKLNHPHAFLKVRGMMGSHIIMVVCTHCFVRCQMPGVTWWLQCWKVVSEGRAWRT